MRSGYIICLLLSLFSKYSKSISRLSSVSTCFLGVIILLVSTDVLQMFFRWHFNSTWYKRIQKYTIWKSIHSWVWSINTHINAILISTDLLFWAKYIVVAMDTFPNAFLKKYSLWSFYTTKSVVKETNIKKQHTCTHTYSYVYIYVYIGMYLYIYSYIIYLYRQTGKPRVSYDLHEHRLKKKKLCQT